MKIKIFNLNNKTEEVCNLGDLPKKATFFCFSPQKHGEKREPHELICRSDLREFLKNGGAASFCPDLISTPRVIPSPSISRYRLVIIKNGNSLDQVPNNRSGVETIRTPKGNIQIWKSAGRDIWNLSFGSGIYEKNHHFTGKSRVEVVCLFVHMANQECIDWRESAAMCDKRGE